MATIDSTELRDDRRDFSRIVGTTTWSKPSINAALQAIEDQWDSAANKTAFGNAIETAAPGVFTNGQKKKLGAIWMARKTLREIL